MLSALARNWWVLLLNGIVAIVFGVLAFTWPGVTLLALVTLYGVYCLADGITALWASFSAKDGAGRSWGHMLFVGIISIGAGITAFVWPHITAYALLVLIAIWAIMRGVFEIVAAISLRKVIDNEWMLGLAGAASVLFGLAVIARPGLGALAIVWMIATFAILRGAILTGLAFKLRGLRPA
jgi:uncharacterized membrane protein HdeD (DUF308 family)